jgi:hypothetical protein
MKGAKQPLFILSLTFLSMIAKAGDDNNGIPGKTDPVIHGSITDASTKKPLVGVLISICNPKCAEKKEFTTDASGNFKVPKMPSGEVTIVLEKKGYKTYRREGVIIKEGMTIKLNLDLKSADRYEDNDFFHPLMRLIDNE